MKNISIIIPFYNEGESLPVLVKRLVNTLESDKEEAEIVLVDDGSTDVSISNLKSQISNLHLKSENLKLISHRKRFGKGKALQTGLENAAGDLIVFMDADLQDDPKDLQRFFEKINHGYDLVNGVRIQRQDNLIVKIYSSMANFFLKTVLHSPFSDVNCGYKAFKKEILDKFILYGNNFRFLPLAAYYQGFKVTEIPVTNHPRQFGRSKFGPRKLIGGVFDTLTAYFIYKFAEKPLHFFGPIGGFMFFAGALISLVLAIERIFFGVLLYRRPMLFLGILLIIVGVQVIMTGIIGELIVYLNKKSQITNNK